jgi:hypothetical protein
MDAKLVEGSWVLSEEALNKAAERLEKHRTDCRERYRRIQATLRQQRPDLFKTKNGHCRKSRLDLRRSQLSIGECVLQSTAQTGDSSPAS